MLAGLLALDLEILGHLDGAGIYAIRRRDRVVRWSVCARSSELSSTSRSPSRCIRHAAVLFRIESTGLPALEKKYHAELTGPGWGRAAYIVLGDGTKGNPRPLFANSSNGELEFLLPPGRVTLHAYGSDVKWVERPIESSQTIASCSSALWTCPRPRMRRKAGSRTIIGCDETSGR